MLALIFERKKFSTAFNAAMNLNGKFHEENQLLQSIFASFRID